jgi:hypothetical protein
LSVDEAEKAQQKQKATENKSAQAPKAEKSPVPDITKEVTIFAVRFWILFYWVVSAMIFSNICTTGKL